MKTATSITTHTKKMLLKEVSDISYVVHPCVQHNKYKVIKGFKVDCHIIGKLMMKDHQSSESYNIS